MPDSKNADEMKQAADTASTQQQLSARQQRKAEKARKKAEKAQAKAAKKAAKQGPGAEGPQPAETTQHKPSAIPQQEPGQATAGQPDIIEPAEGQGFVPAVVGSTFTPQQLSEEQQATVEKNRKRRRRRSVIAAVLVTLLVLVGVGSAGAYVYLQHLNQNLAGEDEVEAEEVRETLTPMTMGDDPFYMLLVGCDDREGVEGTRADTTILARIDPGNNVVTLISIPRDTAIDIPGYGTQKFNAAYTYEGASGTITAASELCGVQISHYAEVHFEALIDIINYIGGVDVDVPIPIDDVDAGGKLDAGYQHLNGEQAMVFARSRSYASGDFQRTTSQRLLIGAAVEKVMSMSPTELPGLLMQVSQSMITDLSVQELLGLALSFQDEPPLVMYSAIVPSTTSEWDGVSYVVTDTYLLSEMMNVVNEGGDPATIVADDYTVSTSEEATEQGIELIINYGDDTPDEGAYAWNDYNDFVYTYYDSYDSYDYDEEDVDGEYDDEEYGDGGYDDSLYEDDYSYDGYGEDQDYSDGYDEEY